MFLNCQKQWCPVLQFNNLEQPEIQERCSHSATLTENGVYFIGGGQKRSTTERFEHFSSVERFDLTNASWSKLECDPSLFTPRRGHSAVLHNERFILVFGGACDAPGRTENDAPGVEEAIQEVTNDLLLYNIQSGHWAVQPTTGRTPAPRRSCLSCIYCGKLIVLAGIGENGLMLEPFVHFLDLETWNWTVQPVTCRTIEGPTSVIAKSNCSEVLNGKLLFFGQTIDWSDMFHQSSESLLMLDLSSCAVEEVQLSGVTSDLFNQDLLFHSTAMIGSVLFAVFGGRADDSELEKKVSMFAIDLSCLPHGVVHYLKVAGEYPLSRNAASLTAFGAKLLLFGGGVYEKVYFNDLYVLEFVVVPDKPLSLMCAEKNEAAEDLYESCVSDEVMFVVNGSEIFASRTQLSRVSSVLKALLMGNFREGQFNVPIDMSSTGLSGQQFAEVIAYAVQDQTTPLPSSLEESTLLDILMFADMYGIEQLKGKCELLFCQRTTTQNLIDFFHIALEFNCMFLLGICVSKLRYEQPGSFWKQKGTVNELLPVLNIICGYENFSLANQKKILHLLWEFEDNFVKNL